DIETVSAVLASLVFDARQSTVTYDPSTTLIEQTAPAEITLTPEHLEMSLTLAQVAAANIVFDTHQATMLGYTQIDAESIPITLTVLDGAIQHSDNTELLPDDAASILFTAQQAALEQSYGVEAVLASLTFDAIRGQVRLDGDLIAPGDARYLRLSISIGIHL